MHGCLSELFHIRILFFIFLAVKDPKLIHSRLNLKEQDKAQKIFNILAWPGIFVFLLIVPALDFRYHWSDVPVWLVIISAIIMISGIFMELIVMTQNRYTSRIIEIREDQKVIDTGSYSVIRHPMYLYGSMVFCSMPLILGSVYAFIAMIILCPSIFIFRIINKEKVLKENLKGYKEYMKKVKYTLIPYVR